MSKFKLSEEQINRLLEIADDSELSEEQYDYDSDKEKWKENKKGEKRK